MLCHELAVGTDRRRRHRLRPDPDGEREIGSWQAGDAEAGLAFYIRRYEDLATEVALLEKRLESGAADPAPTRTHAIEMTRQLPTAAAIGDLDSLADRLSALLVAAQEKAARSGRTRAGPGRARSRPRRP